MRTPWPAASPLLRLLSAGVYLFSHADRGPQAINPTFAHMRAPQGLHRDSTGTPQGLHRDSTGTPQGLHRDSTGTPQGLHRDSTGNQAHGAGAPPVPLVILHHSLHRTAAAAVRRSRVSAPPAPPRCPCLPCMRLRPPTCNGTAAAAGHLDRPVARRWLHGGVAVRPRPRRLEAEARRRAPLLRPTARRLRGRRCDTHRLPRHPRHQVVRSRVDPP